MMRTLDDATVSESSHSYQNTNKVFRKTVASSRVCLYCIISKGPWGNVLVSCPYRRIPRIRFTQIR